MSAIRLGVNIDHVATLRNARGGGHPDPVRAAITAAEAGADGITAHLREDRRHIRDNDIEQLTRESNLPLNLEMAATDEMLAIVLKTRPHAVCIVPEKRQEITTEGGLDVIAGQNHLREYIKPLKAAGIRVSLFIDPVVSQIDAAHLVGAQVVELHTGKYCKEVEKVASCKLQVARVQGGVLHDDLAGEILRSKIGDGASPKKELRVTCHVSRGESPFQELSNIKKAASYAMESGLECHAGHGLSFDTVAMVAAIPEIIELNIGHFIIGEAVFTGLKECIIQMKKIMREART